MPARSLCFALLLALTPLLVQSQDRPLTVVYLVRHAETGPREGRPDPDLSEAGRQRADALARLLGEAGIDRLFSTDYARTRETTRPLASRLDLPVETYDPRALAGFARRLEGLGGSVLVAGHSNTTPALVSHLGGDPGPPIDDATEYDRLYVVTLLPDGGVHTARLRYGAPSVPR